MNLENIREKRIEEIKNLAKEFSDKIKLKSS